jgi:fatty-acyl-CoA synthase
VAGLLLRRAADDAVGLRAEDDWWSWRQVVDESCRRAAVLERLRVPGPFHVGVLLENVPEYVFLLGGAALAGAVVVGVNPTRRGGELASDIAHTDCQVVLTDAAGAALLEGLDIGARIVLVDGAAYRRALEDASPEAPRDLPAPAALYLLLFTSGSTGAPKAVKVSQGRLASGALAMARGAGFGPGQVLYCAMPMFHGNALTTCVVPAVASGATLVLRRRFSASGFLPDARRFGVTYFNYVGRALAHILATPAASDDADTTLRMVFGTDASLADIAAFGRRFGCVVAEGYGSSEGAIAMAPALGMPRGALGKPPPGIDVAVVDEHGEERAPARFDAEGRLVNAEEAIGEIVSRDGAGRFEGYYANPEAEAQRTRRGWYWSGDLGYRDEAGWFYFAGRTDDWMRVDGENFAAAPVERLLERYPPVRVAVVYAVPDPRTGDQVMAALEVEEPDAFDPEAFASFLAAQPDLGTKWTPRFVRLMRQVPATASGKVDKRPLRAEGWQTGDPLWWWPVGERAVRYRRFGPGDGARLRRAYAEHGRLGLLGG